jgi:hypothetical protein
MNALETAAQIESVLIENARERAERAGTDYRPADSVTDEICNLILQGWHDSEIIDLYDCTEEFNPFIDEDYACARMSRIHERVQNRLDNAWDLDEPIAIGLNSDFQYDPNS